MPGCASVHGPESRQRRPRERAQAHAGQVGMPEVRALATLAPPLAEPRPHFRVTLTTTPSPTQVQVTGRCSISASALPQGNARTSSPTRGHGPAPLVAPAPISVATPCTWPAPHRVLRTKAQRSEGHMATSYELMRSISVVGACLCFSACGSDDAEGRPIQPKAFADVMFDVGIWYEPVMYTGSQSITGCGDACREVVIYRFERVPQPKLTLEFYYDQAPPGFEDGQLRCSESYRLTPVATTVEGRAVWEHALLEDGDCLDQPALFVQSYQLIESRDGSPTLVANWTVKKPDDAFAGWSVDGGKAFAIAPCPASARAPGRAYCMPTCVVGSAEGPACHFPSP
jgi:hypothetical protein